MRNEGIHVSGHGQVRADTLAVGRGATAVGGPGASDGLADLKAQLDRLIAALEDHVDELPDGPQVVQAAEQARQELDRPEPNVVSLRGLLGGVAGAVASVASLATSVQSIQAAVAQVL